MSRFDYSTGYFGYSNLDNDNELFDFGVEIVISPRPLSSIDFKSRFEKKELIFCCKMIYNFKILSQFVWFTRTRGLLCPSHSSMQLCHSHRSSQQLVGPSNESKTFLDGEDGTAAHCRPSQQLIGPSNPSKILLDDENGTVARCCEMGTAAPRFRFTVLGGIW